MNTWEDSFEIVTSEIIWNQEFEPNHDVEGGKYPWIGIKEAPMSEVEAESIGALSKEDWSCIALAEAHSDESVVVTNDRRLRQVANERGLVGEWGGRFVIRTMKKCAISEQEYQTGIPPYAEDTNAPNDVVQDLKDAEKPVS
jgi:hypothetical protein